MSRWDKLKRSAKAKLAMVLMLADLAESKSESLVESMLPGSSDRGGLAGSVRAQTSAVLTVVVLGVVLIVGTLIFSQIQQSLPSPTNSELDNASGNVTSGFADAMNLAPVILIVLIASVVLAIVQRFR